MRQLTKLSKLEIPSSIISDLHGIKDNDEAVRRYGVDLAVKMCRELLDSGMVSCIPSLFGGVTFPYQCSHRYMACTSIH